MKIGKSNIKGREWREMEFGRRFHHQRIGLTDGYDNPGIGCAVFRVRPGSRAFPRHAHLNNDEAVYVLEGRGTMEIGDERVGLEPGDFMLLPRGGDFAHAFVNDGDAPLVYLCVSTNTLPDVVDYPDAGKVGVLEPPAPGSNQWSGPVGGFYQRLNTTDYWAGEDPGDASGDD